LRISELERENTALRSFAWTASHDLKEPLRGIIMHLELLANSVDGKIEPQDKEHLRLALTCAHLMSAVLPAVEDFVRIQTEPPSLGNVDCKAVVDNAVLLLRCPIAECDGAVTWTALPEVYSSETLLTHVFLNLIDNALRYRSELPPRVTIDCKRKGGEWLFSVSDNGSGIDPKYRDYIFEPFGRLHTRRKSGAGIGLALCRLALEQLGGRIWVDGTQNGRGSIFRFTLPAET
jgi:light-regulated signal transduction histidine kinase (bacteriophytochrome)